MMRSQLSGLQKLDIGRVRCRTGIGSPETNGVWERFYRTVKEEFYAVAFRKTFYESQEQMQRDLDQ